VEFGLRAASLDALPRDARDAHPALHDLLPDGRTVALYFGSEFCEDRLPDAREAREACGIARERGWEPTLLTPLVSPSGLPRLAALLGALGAAGERPAVVFNDWGVLELLLERWPAWPRRAGRLVNRSLRDPRAYDGAPQGPATHDAARYARLRALLRGFGVTALESDADLEGGYLGDGDDGLARALHVPFTYAASGRGCPLKAALYPAGGGFAKAFADPCSAPCRGKPLPVQRDDTPLAHWRAGNTVLYEPPHEALRRFLAHADRVVVHAQAMP
jgi:hypothetical protein